MVSGNDIGRMAAMSASPSDTSSYRPNVPLLALVPGAQSAAGIMVLTIPASLLMARIGRRWGFTVGATLSVLFGVIAAVAVWVQSFELLCVAAFLKGSAAAFAHYYRFAAADVSPEERAAALGLLRGRKLRD